MERARRRLERRGRARRLARSPRSIAVPDSAFDGAALLVSVPAGGDLTTIKAALVKAGATVRSAALVGSHATRYTVPRQQAASLPTEANLR